MNSQVELLVGVELDPDADAAELEARTLSLRREILELDVDGVEEPVVGPPPSGTKGPEVALLGSLVVSAGQEVIGAVVRVIAGWLSRGGSRTVKIQLGDDILELDAASKDEQTRLIEAFLARHAPAKDS